jgi:hypothetical protein
MRFTFLRAYLSPFGRGCTSGIPFQTPPPQQPLYWNKTALEKGSAWVFRPPHGIRPQSAEFHRWNSTEIPRIPLDSAVPPFYPMLEFHCQIQACKYRHYHY